MPARSNPLARVLAFALLIAAPLSAQDSAQPILSVDSGSRVDASMPLELAGFDLSLSSALWLEAIATLRTGSTKLLVDLDAALLSGAASKAAALLYPGAFIAPSGDAAFAFRVRRLSVSFDFEAFRLVAGRQVVNLGRGTVFSPADIFQAVELSGTSARRGGVDALRLTVPLGELSGLEAIGALAPDFASGEAALRLFASPLGWDVAALGAWDGAEEAASFTLDFKGDAIVGLYGEGLLVWTPASGALEFTAMLGADWSAGDFVFAMEYRYASSPEAPGLAAAKGFPAAHYLYGSCALALGLDATLALAAIVDPANAIDVESLSLACALPDAARVVASVSSASGAFRTGASTRTLSLSLALEASF